MTSVDVDIEVLVVAGCPNAEPARARLQAVLDETGLAVARLTVTVVDSQAEAVRRGFTGSPTFLLDGVDPFPTAVVGAALACRLYETDEGVAGLPSATGLAQAIAAHQQRARRGVPSATALDTCCDGA